MHKLGMTILSCLLFFAMQLQAEDADHTVSFRIAPDTDGGTYSKFYYHYLGYAKHGKARIRYYLHGKLPPSDNIFFGFSLPADQQSYVIPARLVHYCRNFLIDDRNMCWYGLPKPIPVAPAEKISLPSGSFYAEPGIAECRALTLLRAN